MSPTNSPATEERLASLSHSFLTDLSRATSGDATLEVSGWSYKPVAGGFGGAIGGTAIYRITLETTTRPPSSLILKILYRRPQESESSPYYWKREYELYRSRWLANMPADTFSTPAIYHTEDFGAACWIWMQDIADVKDDWDLAEYQHSATRLGRFNGAWLERSLPEAKWLAHNWHSAIVPALADCFAELDDLLAAPLAQIALPLTAKAEIQTIWQERALYQGALAELPRTLCHNDAFRRNVLHQPDGDIVLLDWALAGTGVLGEDLTSLVAVSLHYDRFSQEFAQAVDEAVFTGYIAGLRQAGWRGDTRLARIGYTCAMTLRGLAGVKQDLNFLRAADNHERLTQIHNAKSIEDVAAFFAGVRHFRLLKMAREAKTLLAH